MALKYVRVDGSNSNDGASNTAGGAWRTIQYAVDSILPGDQIIVMDGVYYETVTIASSGTAQQYKSIDFGAAILDGNYTIPSGAFVSGSDGSAPTDLDGTQTGLGYADAALLTISGAYWNISQCKIRNSRGHGMDIKYSGAAIQGNNIDVEAYNNRGSGVKITGLSTDYTKISNIVLTAKAYNNGLFFPYARDWADMPWVPAIDLRFFTGLSTQDGTTAYQNWGEGLCLNGHDISLGNYGGETNLFDNYNANLKISRCQSLNIFKMRNWWSNDPTFMRDGTDGGYAVLFDMDASGTGSTNDCFLYGNIFVGNFSSIVHFEGNATSSGLIQIYHNSMYFNSANGAYSMSGTFDTSFSNVIVQNNSHTSIGGTADTISGTPSNINADYNHWQNCTPSASLDGTNDVTGVAQFVNPQYSISPLTYWVFEDYIIGPTSPLIGESNGTYSAPDAGNPSTTNSTDIGAYKATNATAPVVTNPGPQRSNTGLFSSLVIQYSEPQQEVVTWEVNGLPPGLSFNAGTATISGVPTEPGLYAVTVVAYDPGNVFDAETFNWEIVGAVIDNQVWIKAERTGLFVQFRVTVPTGKTPTYSFDFGDGSTPATNGPTFSRTYASAGAYTCAVTCVFSDGTISKRKRRIRVGGSVNTYQS